MEESDLRALSQRFEAAASRLKHENEQRRDLPPYATPANLGEVLEGLEQAKATVRRARRRLAEIEAQLNRP